MRALLSTEFAALLATADVGQAAFARLAGVTPRQVNNWARGRALVPQWAALLAVALLEHTAEALVLALEEAKFSWAEVLSLRPNAEHQRSLRSGSKSYGQSIVRGGKIGCVNSRFGGAMGERMPLLSA